MSAEETKLKKGERNETVIDECNLMVQIPTLEFI